VKSAIARHTPDGAATVFESRTTGILLSAVDATDVKLEPKKDKPGKRITNSGSKP